MCTGSRQQVSTRCLFFVPDVFSLHRMFAMVRQRKNEAVYKHREKSLSWRSFAWIGFRELRWSRCPCLSFFLFSWALWLFSWWIWAYRCRETIVLTCRYGNIRPWIKVYPCCKWASLLSSIAACRCGTSVREWPSLLARNSAVSAWATNRRELWSKGRFYDGLFFRFCRDIEIGILRWMPWAEYRSDRNGCGCIR